MASSASLEFINRDWLRHLHRSLGTKCGHARFMVPFIKMGAVKVLLANCSPARIHVLTRFNLADCRDRASDLGALRILLERGAHIRGVKGLHSKLYAFDNRTAIIGSANLTLAALRTNHELGVIVRDSVSVQACVEYFDEIWDEAGRDLTPHRLDEWQKEIDEATERDKSRGKASTLKDYGTKIAQSVDEVAPLVLAPPLEREVYVKIFGEAENRAPLHASIVETVRRDASHWACTYPKGRRPRRVKDGDVMYFARMVTPSDYRIYGRGFALAHVPGRDDASENEVEYRSWKEQWPHYIRVHNVEFINSDLNGGVSLFEMLKELHAAAFANTWEKQLQGDSTNPRLSLRQRPDVKLAPAGAAWLAAEFDRRIQMHGRIAPEAIEVLDMPKSAAWLSRQGRALLEYLIARIDQGETNDGDPESYPTYLEVAQALRIADRSSRGLARAIRRNGLDDLDDWIRRFRLPAISGFIVRADTRRPGDAFFTLHGHAPNDEQWWRRQLRESARYPWRNLVD